MRPAVALAVALAAATPASAGPAAEAQRLQSRLETIARAGVLGVSAYQPQQSVAGDPIAPRLPPPPTRPPIAPAALAKAQAYSDAHDGVCLAVWTAGRLQHEQCRAGVGPADRTETFSMNKSVTALMIGAAIADGRIGSVDDPVGQHLKAWRNDPRGAITLRQLLSMCSGLKVFRAAADDLQGLRLAVSDRVEETALSAPLESAPGVEFAYNNANPQVAGAVLRRVLGGRSYAEYLSERLWRPIGARSAKLWAESPTGAPHFSSGLQASLEDWVRIGLLVLHRGRVGGRQVLPGSWIDEMTRPSACNDKYGLGVWLAGTYAPRRGYGRAITATVAQSEPFLAQDLVFFDGAGGQRVYISAQYDLVIVRTGEPRADFDDAVIPNAVVRGLRQANHRRRVAAGPG